MATGNKLLRKKKTCCFCHLSEDNEFSYGKMHTLGNIVTHYYCLLFSSNMEQNGEDDEGILGFLANDIRKELIRGEQMLCTYCKKQGATLTCCVKKCKKAFHYPCGQLHGSLHQFFGHFKSFCPTHRPVQKISAAVLQEVAKSKAMCAICYEDVQPRPCLNTLWAPCCSKNTWFHRVCLQKLAMSAGYFFKCPLCNSTDTFHSAMKEFGIFIPEQDASWEMEPNAFQELLHRHDRCDAPKCKCTKGRNYHMQGTPWELVLCRLCGSQGVHLQCGKLKWNNPEFDCSQCSSMLVEGNNTSQPMLRKRCNSSQAKNDPTEEAPTNDPPVDESTSQGGKRRVSESPPDLTEEDPPCAAKKTKLEQTPSGNPSSEKNVDVIVLDDGDSDIEVVDDLEPQNVLVTVNGAKIHVVDIPISGEVRNFSVAGDLNVSCQTNTPPVLPPTVSIAPSTQATQHEECPVHVGNITSIPAAARTLGLTLDSSSSQASVQNANLSTPANQVIPRAMPPANQATPRAMPPANQATPRAMTPANQATPRLITHSNQATPRLVTYSKQSTTRLMAPANQVTPRLVPLSNQTTSRLLTPANQTAPRFGTAGILSSTRLVIPSLGLDAPGNQAVPRVVTPTNQPTPKFGTAGVLASTRFMISTPRLAALGNQATPENAPLTNQVTPRFGTAEILAPTRLVPRLGAPANQTAPRPVPPTNQATSRLVSLTNQTLPRLVPLTNQATPRLLHHANKNMPRLGTTGNLANTRIVSTNSAQRLCIPKADQFTNISSLRISQPNIAPPEVGQVKPNEVIAVDMNQYAKYNSVGHGQVYRLDNLSDQGLTIGPMGYNQSSFTISQPPGVDPGNASRSLAINQSHNNTANANQSQAFTISQSPGITPGNANHQLRFIPVSSGQALGFISTQQIVQTNSSGQSIYTTPGGGRSYITPAYVNQSLNHARNINQSAVSQSPNQSSINQSTVDQPIYLSRGANNQLMMVNGSNSSNPVSAEYHRDSLSPLHRDGCSQTAKHHVAPTAKTPTESQSRCDRDRLIPSHGVMNDISFRVSSNKIQVSLVSRPHIYDRPVFYTGYKPHAFIAKSRKKLAGRS